MTLPDLYTEPAVAAKIALISESFARLLGRPLVPPGSDPMEGLWSASPAIVAHGTQADPIFFFGNQVALELFETTPAQFITMPSRLSAEAPLRAEREALFVRVAEHGFLDDYSGMRISAKGRRFMIERGVVWTLVDAHGQVHGQAAAFDPPRS